jgi:FAD/FMN-containing dehydrogenase
MEDALALFGHLRELGPALQSADYFHRLGMELVCAHRGFAQPFPELYDTYVTVECAARDDPSEALAEAAAAADHVIRDAALATDLDGRRSLWSYRESHNETIAARGVPHKLDVTVPLERVAAFEREVAAVVAARWPDAETVLYGHLGDGNVHVNVTGPDPRDMGVDDVVLEIVAAHHGSISAEHGVGFAKARYLGLSRSTAEIGSCARSRARSIPTASSARDGSSRPCPARPLDPFPVPGPPGDRDPLRCRGARAVRNRVRARRAAPARRSPRAGGRGAPRHAR